MTSAEASANGRALLPRSTRRRIFLYLGGLIALSVVNNPSGGLLDVPVAFFLKNRLHWEANELAWFRLVASIPLYVSILFGLARDNLVALGFADRALVGWFGLIGLVLHAVFAVMTVSAPVLLAAMVLLTCSALFVVGAQNGLASTLGQQHAMSGQVSAVWNIFNAFPAIAAPLLGGVLSDALGNRSDAAAARVLFLAGGAVSALLMLYAILKPASVYGNIRTEHAPAIEPLADLKRLLRHKPIYPAMTVWLLWNFAPGSTTPLQYHLQDVLHASDAQWGAWNAIFAASFLPTFLLFGMLCRRHALGTLLLWGTLAAIPQFTPLLFVRSVDTSLIAAAPIGLMGGLATAAYLDLIIRSCPPGLQGTTLMLSGGLYYVSARFGDVLGTILYDRSGSFTLCVAMITLVYALILPVLRWIPADLVTLADGEIADTEADSPSAGQV